MKALVLVCTILAQIGLTTIAKGQQLTRSQILAARAAVGTEVVGGIESNSVTAYQKQSAGRTTPKWYYGSAGLPVGNWSANGFEAVMYVSVAPLAECDDNFWKFSAENFAMNEIGAIQYPCQPRDFGVFAKLSWADFVNTENSGINFFRGFPLSSVRSPCQQWGTKVVVALVVKKTPEPIDLSCVSGGAISSENQDDPNYSGHFIDWRFGYLGGSYSDYIKGVTPDGTVLHNGEAGGTPISKLYYTGFWISNPVYSQSDIDNQRNYFMNGGCLYVSFYFQVVGRNSGNVLFNGQIDMPVNPSADPNYPSFPGSFGIGIGTNGVALKVKAWESQVWFIDQTANINTPQQWTPLYTLPVFSGEYSLPAGESRQFFRMRQ